jgi:CAAX prenyl protease-like protein
LNTAIRRPSWLPYVLPMAAFLILTSLEGYLPRSTGDAPEPRSYAIAYAAKVLIVSALMFACRPTWRDLRPFPGVPLTLASIVLGLAITALWVTIPSPEIPFLGGGTRQGFDPGTLDPALRYVFLALRFFGLVLMVPLFEELFWRSFLMRWVIDQDFEKVLIGKVTPIAALITSALFALAHPEWVPALITGLAWAGLLWKTKSVSACVISHMAANLGLGIYVMATGSWIYW